MKTLNTIQILSKIARILCKIIFVCCIVGAALCAVGIITLACLPQEFTIGELTLHQLAVKHLEVSLNTCYAAMAYAIVICAAQAVLCKIAERYFTNELKAGTPFTFDGAKELIRLGIITICVSIGAEIVAGTVYGVMKAVMQDVADPKMRGFGSVGLGLTFIIVGLIFRCGAEISAANATTANIPAANIPAANDPAANTPAAENADGSQNAGNV